MPRHPRVHAEGLLYHVKARFFSAKATIRASSKRFGLGVVRG
jgi:hypothetical protein